MTTQGFCQGASHMRAALFENHCVKTVELDQPRPGRGQALVRVLRAGICRTDLELLSGYHHFQGVAGHEFVGRVEAAPDQPELEGRRVVADINIGCGECPPCRGGDPRHCPRRRVIGIRRWPGAFAQYLLVPVQNLHPVPPGISDSEAVFSEPLAAALQISQQVHLTAGQRLAVLGDGKLGLLAALALRHYCPRLILLGHHRAKLKLAADQGVEALLLPPGPEGDKTLAGLEPFDLVVEATGQPQGIEHALALVRPGGTVVLKTTSHQHTNLDLSRVVVNEITLLGSRCGDMSLALDFLQHHRLQVEPLVEAVYPLARLSRALEHARRPGALKILLECD